MYPDSYEIDLKNEILNIDFGLKAAKISEVKIGGRKKHLPISVSRRKYNFGNNWIHLGPLEILCLIIGEHFR